MKLGVQTTRSTCAGARPLYCTCLCSVSTVHMHFRHTPNTDVAVSPRLAKKSGVYVSWIRSRYIVARRGTWCKNIRVGESANAVHLLLFMIELPHIRYFTQRALARALPSMPWTRSALACCSTVCSEIWKWNTYRPAIAYGIAIGGDTACRAES